MHLRPIYGPIQNEAIYMAESYVNNADKKIPKY